MSAAGTTLSRMLTAHETRILDFEREWSGRLDAKESAIRAAFGWSAARYYQRLDEILHSRVALKADPVLVHRLIRLRDEVAEVRKRRTFRRAS